MTDEHEQAIITHDTYRITAVNKAACEMFRCDENDLIDTRTINGIHDKDFKGLVKLRFKVMRESGDLPPQKLPFTRSDNTRFWAEVETHNIGGGLFETTITYLYEY